MKNTYGFVTRRRKRDTEGVNDSCWDVQLSAVGKGREENPYLIANEWIAANIGQFLRLPIPPFSLIQGRDAKTRMFASLSFEGNTSPADVKPNTLWLKHPELCTGIVLFDVLIGNTDRHEKNIKVDNSISPGRLYLFDHDRALMCAVPEQGIEWLEKTKNDPLLRWHCLREVLNTAKHFREWRQRISSIPSWFISDVCEVAKKECGIRKDEANAAMDFLMHRKDEIDGLVIQNKHLFPNVSDFGMFL